MLTLAIVFFIVLIGACMQRIAGMGLGLIAGPVLALVMGPVDGIMVLNILATVNALAISWTVKEHIDWPKFRIIAPFLVLGAIPGAMLIKSVSVAWMQIIVGALLLIALAVVTFLKDKFPPARGKGPAMVAGIFGGFMNTLAGIAGPSITVYAQASRWEPRAYAATLQPLFVVAGLFSFIVKLLSGAGELHASPWVWPVGFAAMFIGIWLGIRISSRVERSKAYKLALLLATAGGISALVRGLLSL